MTQPADKRLVTEAALTDTLALKTAVRGADALPSHFLGANPQFVARMNVKPNRVCQSFFRDPHSNLFYTAQLQAGNDETDMLISRCTPAGDVLDTMLLQGGGHGSQITAECQPGQPPQIYIPWQKAVGGGTAGPVKVTYKAGTTKVSDTNVQPIPNPDGAKTHLYSIDQANDEIGIHLLEGTYKDSYVVRRFSEFKAGVDNVLKRVGPIDRPSDVSMQGFQLIDGVIYSGHDSVFSGDATVLRPTIYKWSMDDPSGANIEKLQVDAVTAGYDGSYYGGYSEIEGFGIDRAPDGTASLLFGMASGPVGGRVYSVFAIAPPGAPDTAAASLRRVTDPSFMPGPVELEIMSGFTARAGYEPAVWKDASGMVHFEGHMNNTGLTPLTANTDILQLPDGYWPAKEARWIGFVTGRASAPWGGWISATTGKITIQADSNNDYPGPSGHFCIIVQPWRAA